MVLYPSFQNQNLKRYLILTSSSGAPCYASLKNLQNLLSQPYTPDLQSPTITTRGAKTKGFRTALYFLKSILLFKNDLLLLFHVYEYFLNVHIQTRIFPCTTYISVASEVRRGSDLLELEIRAIVRHPVGAGN